MTYEEKQDAALRMLAGAIQGVAATQGQHVGDLVAHVNEILSTDEPPPPVVDLAAPEER